ncbi:synembryn-A isoform X2 [Synchiropus splendidus]|uniref:synembryn-A isoform X2 n=1 Tax=Synchiropus splendidus TaxID=270530 RepID=UPI00237DFF80|nr:synembryn-A isoform X2 [Synchiropus splendidus]
MDLNSIIEEIETGEQDGVLLALQRYNEKMNECFTFRKEECDTEEVNQQKRLGELVLDFLSRELQPPCQLACLETARILSRDKHCLQPFVNCASMSTLARCASISVVTGEDAGSTEGAEEGRREEEASSDDDVTIEALKCICNILLHNELSQVVAVDLQLIRGVTNRLKKCSAAHWSPQVIFFDLRLTFLLTALRVDVRSQLAQELHGICLLGQLLDTTLCVGRTDSLESIGSEDLPPLSREQTEIGMEILKILFNITFDTTRRKVDEEDAAKYRRLGAVLRHCLVSRADGEERTEEFHGHTVNLLSNLPLPCLDVFLTPKVTQGSVEYMGVNMDAVNILLEFMEKRLDGGQKLKENLLPSLNLLTESARIHRETRKFLRSKVLPPLRDVKSRPEVGDALRNKLVRLMTHVDTDVKASAAEFLFILCKENVSRFIKYTGYGNAAGLLAARGLLRGGSDSGIYSEDEDSETEEYREARAQINPITGVVEDEQPNPMEGMTEEQKELEAMKLVNMFDKLSRNNMIKPMQLTMDGEMREVNPDLLLQTANNQPDEQQNSDNED